MLKKLKGLHSYIYLTNHPRPGLVGIKEQCIKLSVRGQDVNIMVSIIYKCTCM